MGVLSQAAVLETVHVENSRRKVMRSFLRQVVSDAIGDDPVLVFPREFAAIDTGVRVRCAIGVAFECDGGNADRGSSRQLSFHVVIPGLSFGQPEPPTV